MNAEVTLFEQFSNISHRFLQEGWMTHVETFAINFIVAGLIYWIGSFIINLLLKGFHRVAKKRRMDVELQHFLDGIIRIGLKFALIIIALSELGIDTTSLLAVFGAAGLAIGLALKDSLSNVASGVMLIWTRPFRIGHLVEIGKARGFVEKITLFNTTLRTPDNKQVTIPNAKIHQDTIINYSANATRRVDIIIGISYDDDVQQARQLILQVIEKNTYTNKEPAPVIAVSELGDSSVNILVRVWTAKETYWETKWSLIEGIKLSFDEQGISIPYPQRDIHLIQNNLNNQE
ncbi:MAG: mechanosensitive ion channel [Cellvibrionales bacterium]|nr:mechanosensitive ion channel [Cellvibrionales bacterium]